MHYFGNKKIDFGNKIVLFRQQRKITLFRQQNRIISATTKKQHYFGNKIVLFRQQVIKINKILKPKQKSTKKLLIA